MKLSSYNIKCLATYVIYCLFFFFFGEGGFFNDDDKNIVFQYIVIPLIVYLLLPFILKVIGTWKPIKWIDGVIDYIYRTIKEPGKQHEMQIEKRTALSTDRSTPITIPKKDHWIWKVLKVLLCVAVIWGTLILIYVIPGLCVPVAVLAGYVGVKMTKKEKNK